METTLKAERLSETTNAANDDTSVKDTTITPQSTPPVAKKSSTIRMVGYPVVIGSVGALAGMALAKKMGKNNKLFIISGLLLGAAGGYALYNRWTKK